MWAQGIFLVDLGTKMWGAPNIATFIFSFELGSFVAFIWPRTQYTAKAGLILIIYMPWPFKCWYHRHIPLSCLKLLSLFFFIFLDKVSYSPILSWTQLIAVDDLDLRILILLSLLLEYCDYWSLSSYSFCARLRIESRSLWMLDKHSIKWVTSTPLKSILFTVLLTY